MIKDIDNRCTFFPNGNWVNCCVAHDYASADAWIQRSAEDRLKADRDLYLCVRNKNHKYIPFIMYFGVRLWYWVKWYFIDNIYFEE